MGKQKIQSGYIECLDKPYIFTYDGELLQLVPKDKELIKPYDSLKNSNQHFEILEGVTQRHERICFLNCKLQVFNSGYISKPAGFICFNSNIDTFDVITFRGGIMDFFYRPNQIVDTKNSSCDYETGESLIKLKSFDETSKYCDILIDDKKANLMISITQPGIPSHLEIDYNLGKPRTILRLTFDDPVEISDFRNIYMWVYNLMVFLNFRKDVYMGEVELGKLNEERKIAKVAYTHIIERDKAEITDINRIIGYYFISNQLNELLQIVNKPDLNLLFIPNSVKSDKYLLPEQYMICCTSFESVFNFAFPNAKMEFSQKANEVKEEFLKYISDKEKEYKGVDAKKRKEFNKYADMIKLLDFGLAEKFEHCQLKYEAIMNNYVQKLKYRLSFTQQEFEGIAQSFAKKRNMFMHNSLEDFEDIHIMAYTLARVFIYAMILEKAGVENDMIIQAIDKVV